MQKGTLWICFILLLGYLMLMFCVTTAESTPPSKQRNNNNNHNQNVGLNYWHNRNATNTSTQTHANPNSKTDIAVNRSFNLEEEARRRHSLYHHRWWWHALAIAYWVKVKVIIVGFFVGSAIFLGLRYLWPHHSKCHGEVYRDSPIVLDHPPHSFSHDHSFSSLPYSASFDPTSFGPSGGTGGGSSGIGGGYTYDIGSSGSDGHRRKRRSIHEMRLQRDARIRARQRQQKEQQEQQQQSHEKQEQLHHHMSTPTEEQIGDMMFYFLGLDSKACRRRFICEMEFRSRLHPLTSMAFRIVGRGFFGKYTNERNERGQAKSFTECAAVNPECVFIEQEQDDDNNNDEQQAAQHTEAETEATAVETVENNLDNELTADGATDDGGEHSRMEQQNAANLKAERRVAQRQRRTNGGVRNLLAQRMWAHTN